MNKFDHYSLLIHESNNYLYYVNSTGIIFKINKTSLSYNDKIYLNPYVKHNNLAIKIHGKEYLLKTLIAMKFSKEYYPGVCIGFKDKNFRNCNIENLYFYSMKEHGINTGYLSKSKQVLIKEFGDQKVFRSVREAAKYLFCSYQTLLDYLNGKNKKSVLKRQGRRICYL